MMKEEAVFSVINTDVLLVDDNEVNLMVGQAMLEFYGITVFMADSGAMALKMIREQEFDIVFMDHLMPEMDGVEVTKKIRNLPFPKENTVVVALSAYLDEEVISKFEQAGVNQVMKKPLELPALGEALRKWIPAYKISDEAEDNMSAILQKPEEKASRNAEYLKNVIGLDYEAGLKSALGNEENYRRLLRASCFNIEKCMDEVGQYPQNYEDGGFKRAVHSLKSIFMNIGLNELAKFSEKFELYAIKCNSAWIDANLEQLKISAGQALLELQQAVLSYNDSREDLSEVKVPYRISEAEMKDRMEEIIRHAEQFEIVALTDKLGSLASLLDGEEKKIVTKAVLAAEQFDYERVKEILKTGRGEAR